MTSELMASVGKLTRMAIENGEQRDAAIARAEAAEAALAKRDKPCVWTVNEYGVFVTACNDAFNLILGEFCPGCGHSIEVAE